MSERETAAGLQKVVSVDYGSVLSVVDPTAFTAALALERDGKEKVESSMWAKRFLFDRCFGEEDSDNGEGQEKVFDEIGTTVIDQAFSGYNATVFAYGQTGSGKSYTMMGSGATLDDTVDPEDHGLIPRICSEIFERVDQIEQDAAFQRPYRGSSSRVSEGHGVDESREGVEKEGVGDSPLPRNDSGPEYCALHEGNFDPTSPSSSFGGKSAAAGGHAGEDSTSRADAVRAEDATATHTEFSVEVSYLEIYNESLRDLFKPASPAATGGNGNGGNTSSGELGGGVTDGGGGGGGGGCGSIGTGLRLREDPTSGTYVEGLTSIAVSSWDEMSQLLMYGGSERTVAATNANDWSSRSHAVFTLTLRQTSEALSPRGSSYECWETCSSVNLVDLAGSERVSHTGATGLRLQEAGSINRSLSALSDVIKALSESPRRRAGGSAGARSPSRRRSPGWGGRGVAATSQRGFVPYRNSVLTRLLKESLGGNSRTVMLACVSPCDVHYEETLGTLRYAERAKRVRTRAVANARRGMSREGAGSEHAALVERLSAQIRELKQQLAEATTTAKSATPMSLPTSPVPPSGGVGTQEGDARKSSLGGFPPLDAAAGQGYIYVVDPALQAEIERLRETVVDRERVIKDMEMGVRHNRHARKLSTTQHADGRDRRPPRQGGDGNAAGESVSLSTRSDVSGRCSSSPSSPASASVSASVSACSGQLSIFTPPRRGGMQDEAMTIHGSRDGEKNETSRENGDVDSGMRLLNLNQDPMFSECMSFLIREDGVTVVGSAEDADVRLTGDDVLPRHAVINFGPDGNVVLTPLSGASVHINGIAISVGAEAIASRSEDERKCSPGLGHDHGHDHNHQRGVLRQDYRVLFGSRHFFRVECSGGLPEGQDGGHFAVEIKPMKIDWEFAQRELRDAATSINNGNSNNTEVEPTPNKIAGETDGLVEKKLALDGHVAGNASAKSEVPEHREEDVAQQPQLSEEANRLGCEEPLPGGGTSAEASNTSGTSEMMGVDTSPSPGALPGETFPARISPSEETSHPVPASAPGDPLGEPALSPLREVNKPADHVPPRTPLGASATPVALEPSYKCDPQSATATFAPVEDGTSPHEEITDTLPKSERVASPAMASAAPVVQTAEPPDKALQGAQPLSEKFGDGDVPTETELSNGDPDERAALDRLTCNADATIDDEFYSQATRVAPPPQPPPLPPPSPKAGGQTEAELSATTKAIQVNKATLVELQRARVAWRGAEAELERSQDERDELRATLQAVQEEARERRRSDRKEKRELDKGKTTAENRARALEADRDRLRQMLSKSDEEVAELRGQLQKAQAAAFDAAAAVAAAGTDPNPGEAKAQSDEVEGPGPVSVNPSSIAGAAAGAVTATFRRHSNRGRKRNNNTAGDANEVITSSGGGRWQVTRPSTLPVCNKKQDTHIAASEDEHSGGGEDFVLSGPPPSTEIGWGIDGAPETAVTRSETEDQQQQHGYDSRGIRGMGRERGSRGGQTPVRKGSAGEVTGEGSEEEDLAGAGAATQSAGKEQQSTTGLRDDDLFLQESRKEVEAARRLLDRHAVTITTATAARENDSTRADVSTSAAAVGGEQSTIVTQPAVGIIRDHGGEASTEKSAAFSPTLGALSHFDAVAETEETYSNSGGGGTRSRPSDRSARCTAGGRGGAEGDFYRAALSTHLSFITTTAADDHRTSLRSSDGGGSAIQAGGRKPAGGVGEACRALQGDVAGVRQRLEAIQSRFSIEEAMSGRTDSRKKGEELAESEAVAPFICGAVMAEGPVSPGEAWRGTMEVDTYICPNPQYSVVSMLINTNDAFLGIDSKNLVMRGSSKVYPPAFDAGTEENNEECAFVPGPGCPMDSSNSQKGPGKGFIHVHRGLHGVGDLADYDWRNPVAEVVLTAR
eukprot:g14998.t1